MLLPFFLLIYRFHNNILYIIYYYYNTLLILIAQVPHYYTPVSHLQNFSTILDVYIIFENSFLAL